MVIRLDGGVDLVGALGGLDAQREVFSLVGRHHRVLVQAQGLLPPQLVAGVLNTFPEYGLYLRENSS